MIGSVYILQNPTMPGYLKIGMTTRTPEARARELSQGIGVAVPYAVAYAEDVIDCDAAERLIHARLDKYRVNHGREFFYLPLRDAVRELSDIAISVGRHERARSEVQSAEPSFNPAVNQAVAPIIAPTPSNTQTKCELPPTAIPKDKVTYSSLQGHSASDMAPLLSSEKLTHLAAIREVVSRLFMAHARRRQNRIHASGS